MNCRSFRKRMVEILDVSSSTGVASELLEHAEACPQCAKEMAESKALLSALGPSHKPVASGDLKERIMNKAMELDSVQSMRRVSPVRRSLVRFALAAVILAAVVLGSARFTGNNGNGQNQAMQLLVQAAEAAVSLNTLHIKARMRTIPADNFDMIVPDRDFVPVEVWTAGPKWRVEKTGRVVVMDGKTTTAMIRPESENPIAIKADSPAKGFIGWLAPLLQVDTLLNNERSLADRQDATAVIEERKGSDGNSKLLLTIQAKAQGDFSESDHSKNSSVLESDNIRIYTFDAKTHRLEGMEVYIDAQAGRTLVFETTEIEYDRPLDASVFELSIPENATWYNTPDEIAGLRDNSAMTPEEVAKAFFEACSRSDWEELRVYAGTLADRTDLRKYLGGLEIISIGKPFRSGIYAGWFVPYEIKLDSGEIKKHNLAIRNDNAKHHWSFDGGL